MPGRLERGRVGRRTRSCAPRSTRMWGTPGGWEGREKGGTHALMRTSPSERDGSMDGGATPTRKFDAAAALGGCSKRTTHVWTSVRAYSRTPSTVACPAAAAAAALPLAVLVAAGRSAANAPSLVRCAALALFVACHRRLRARSMNMDDECSATESITLSRLTYGHTSSVRAGRLWE
eukprot:465-Chlamydomonas_euryale.AAC.1